MEGPGLGSALREVECRVCGDKASGKHYGVPSCDGCRGFFKRSIRRNLDYVCKEAGSCIVDVTRRNQCQSCRFKKCLKVNMKRDAVQHERAPRASGLSNGKGRLPIGFQPFSHSAQGGSSGLYFQQAATAAAVLGNSSFKIPHSGPSSCTPSGFYMGSTSFLHHPFPPTGRLFPQHSGLRVIDLVDREGHLGQGQGQLKEKTPQPQIIPSREEEVSTTTSVDPPPPLDLYHHHSQILSSNESVYESAAKFLFLSIKWARSVPSFGSLSPSDQAILLENSWAELFILSAVQWGLILDDGFIQGKGHRDIVNARRLMDILAKVATLNPDHTELACLKAVVLFKPEVVSLSAELRVEVLQEQTLLMLQEYVNAKSPHHKIRFGKLLLLFSSLKSISSSDLEQLFFKHTVGEVSIQKLISDLVKSNF